MEPIVSYNLFPSTVAFVIYYVNGILLFFFTTTFAIWFLNNHQRFATNSTSSLLMIPTIILLLFMITSMPSHIQLTLFFFPLLSLSYKLFYFVINTPGTKIIICCSLGILLFPLYTVINIQKLHPLLTLLMQTTHLFSNGQTYHSLYS